MTKEKLNIVRSSNPGKDSATDLMRRFDINIKQATFCVELQKDNNQTQSAIRAGYSKKTATAIGSRLLRFVNVVKCVNYLKRCSMDRTMVTVDSTITELARIAFSNIADHVSYGDGKFTLYDSNAGQDTSAVKKVMYQYDKDKDGNVNIKESIELYDKLKALDMLAKYLKLYGDDAEGSVDNSINIQINYQPTTIAEFKERLLTNKIELNK